MEEINNSNLGVSFGDLFGEIDGFPSIDKDEPLWDMLIQQIIDDSRYRSRLVDRPNCQSA